MSPLTIAPLGISLHLLPEKAVYLESLHALLVADVHLGKSETFQASGVPIPSQVNTQTLAKLQRLCQVWQPQELIILGDLFHSVSGLAESVQQDWLRFLQTVGTSVTLVLGNHDRPLAKTLVFPHLRCQQGDWLWHNLLLSHAPSSPETRTLETSVLNICGHVHPCVRLRTGLDALRLPCFYWDPEQALLMLPAFGEFTGGHDLDLSPSQVAYAIAEGTIVPIPGSAMPRQSSRRRGHARSR